MAGGNPTRYFTLGSTAKDEQAAGVFPMRSLWKFLSLAPNQSPEWQARVQQLVVEGRAYYPSPRQFNDPFDCLPHVSAPKTKEEVHAKSDQLITRMIESIPDFSPDFIRTEMQTFLAERTPGELDLLVRKSVENTSGKIGVFCLAECIDSVLMWSHYAVNHQGIALRFDLGLPDREGLPPFFKVRYDDHRPSLGDLYEGSQKSGDITDALATKAKFWEYEQEWRSFHPGGAGDFVSYNPAVVSGIIFGANCSPDREEEVRNIVSSRTLEFFKATPSRDTFDLKFVQC